MNPEQIRAYLDANPQIRDATAQWLREQGEQRDVYTWVLADIQQNPQSVHRQQYADWQNAGSPLVSQTPDLPPEQLNDLIARADAGDQTAITALQAAGYEQTTDTDNLPIEQGILQTALPGLMGDIEGDAARRTLVDTLSKQATQDYDLARTALSPEENARRLLEEYAQADKTAGAIGTSADQAAAQQLAAFQASIEAMKGNLTGELAAKAEALQQQIAAFTANLNTFDAVQKAALAEQIAANQQNLEQSVAARQQALAAEAQSLRTAVDAQSVARRAALQAEIDSLTAAQLPMSQARLDSANALTTAVNLGLEATNDALTAQRAKQGYIGSSSFSDANLARAAIAARQQGAQAMGGAREANAADLRAIQARGATEGRGIADELAGGNLSIAGREAEGTRSLADILAEGQRTIGDTGAAGTAAIKASTGASQKGIGDTGAAQSYQDKVVGSNELQALLDTLAKGNATIAGQSAVAQQGARDQGTMAKQGYFDNAYTRGQGALLSRPGLSTNLAGTLTSLGNYGQSGLNRSLGALNWWAGNQGTPPTIGTTPAVVDNSGNDIAGLGAGLLGSALNIGNSKNWWAKPDGIGEKTTYEQFLKDNPASWAATGQPPGP